MPILSCASEEILGNKQRVQKIYTKDIMKKFKFYIVMTLDNHNYKTYDICTKNVYYIIIINNSILFLCF